MLNFKEFLKELLLISKICPFCGSKFNTTDIICPKCSNIIKMHNQQDFCRICGKFISINLKDVFDYNSLYHNKLKSYDASGNNICSQCKKEKPPFAAARGVALYHGLLKENIYKFKYHGYRSLGPFMARIMVDKIVNSPEFNSIDVIIPVPITQQKLLKRRYNHTVLLAEEIGRQLNIPVYQEALVRVTDYSSQSKLNRNERAVNIKGAFKTNIGYNLLNKKILLVDDIVTTGATITECSRLLKIYGAKEILVISLVTGRTNF